MLDGIGWTAAAASLSLIGSALLFSWAIGLQLGRDIIVASARAAVQLLTVGLLFTLMFESAAAKLWAWLWVGAMVLMAFVVIRRRAGPLGDRLGVPVGLAITLSTAVSLVVIFGLGVIDDEPVAIVVVAGITIGNAVPVTVLGIKQGMNLCQSRGGEIEATLALGFDRREVVRFFAPDAARLCLVPQIERTKVVGIIALPGAMTGLLLAGVDPATAVVVQLIVMYLVLGSAAICAITVVTWIVRSAVTPDLSKADWLLPAPD